MVPFDEYETVLFAANSKSYQVLRPKIRTFLRVCWTDTYSGLFSQVELAGMLAELESEGMGGIDTAEDVSVIVVLDRQVNIVATCFYAERDGIGIIWGLYVRLSDQRCNVGGGLVARVRQNISPESGIVLLVLCESVGAHEFWKAVGFQAVTEQMVDIVPGLSRRMTVMHSPSTVVRPVRA